MSRNPLLAPNRSYTFSNYFDLSVDEIDGTYFLGMGSSKGFGIIALFDNMKFKRSAVYYRRKL